MRSKFRVFAFMIFLVCCPRAYFGEEPTELFPDSSGMKCTIVPLDEFRRWYQPGEGKNSGPALFIKPVLTHFPGYGIFLPAAAQTRVDVCNDVGEVLWILIDEKLQKGAYELRIEKWNMRAGNYILRLLTDGQVAGTEKFFTVGDSRGGITILPLSEADMQYFPAEAGKDGPVLFNKPDPSSNRISYCLYLPEAANLSIELYDEKGNKESKYLDVRLERGTHELRIGLSFFQAGRHTMGVLVNNKLMKTQKMHILK